MRRVRQFLLSRAAWWAEQVGRRGLGEGPQREGETAYALRQAGIQSALADSFAKQWETVPDLIRRGRAGELVDEAEEPAPRSDADSDEEEANAGSSGEEDEPIPTLPQREVKSTYVDEVLVM